MSLTTSPWLAEGAVILVQDHIKSNIASALTSVRTMRGDAITTTEPPKDYFIFPTEYNYRCPAVFVMCEDFDFNQSVTAANHVNGKARVNVSVVVEERDQKKLTYKCWRYQSALHRVLAGATLETPAQDLVLTIVVKKESFSPMYSNAKDEGSTGSVFRKEVLFEYEVHQRENF